MDYIPFILSVPDDQEQEASTNVVEFPRDVTAHADLREACRQLQRCEENIANDDIRSTDTRERVRAACSIAMLDLWRDRVRKAEAEVAMLGADDTLTFRGRSYRADRSTNGAN